MGHLGVHQESLTRSDANRYTFSMASSSLGCTSTILSQREDSFHCAAFKCSTTRPEALTEPRRLSFSSFRRQIFTKGLNPRQHSSCAATAACFHFLHTASALRHDFHPLPQINIFFFSRSRNIAELISLLILTLAGRVLEWPAPGPVAKL